MLTMVRFALPWALTVMAFFAGTASATTIGTGNPYGIPPAATQPLQEILDDLVVSGPPIDANAPSGAQLFEHGDAPVGTELLFRIPESEGLIAFGIYDPENPDNRAYIYVGGWLNSNIASLTFGDGGVVTIDDGSAVQTYTGFDGPFGFFIKTVVPGSEPVFLFSEDDLNGGTNHLKAFQGNGETTLQFPGADPSLFLSDEFLLAWEAGTGDGNDGDFTDYIVSVSAVTAVPEPGAAALLGLALVGALARMRKARR